MRVFLHTILQKQTANGWIRTLDVDLPEGATLHDLITFLDLKVDDENTIFVVQGKIAERDQALFPGAEVHFIPAISGGANRI